MSLNRRLFTWLLGAGDEKSATHYFEAYSKSATVAAISESFDAQPTSKEQAVLPYKILCGLIEKEDISFLS